MVDVNQFQFLSIEEIKSLLIKARLDFANLKLMIDEKRLEKAVLKTRRYAEDVEDQIRELTVLIREEGFGKYEEKRNLVKTLSEILHQKEADFRLQKKAARKNKTVTLEEEEEILPVIIEKLSKRKNIHPGSQKSFDLDRFGEDEDIEPEVGEINDKEVERILLMEKIYDEEFA